MEFPFGHHSHSHHRRRDERDEEYPPPAQPPTYYSSPPPPSSYYGVNEPPPPPHVNPTHVYHSSHVGPGGGGGSSYPPYPPAPSSDFHAPQPHPPSHGYDYSDSPSFKPPPPHGYGYSDSPSFKPPTSHGYDYSDSPSFKQPPPPSHGYDYSDSNAFQSPLPQPPSGSSVQHVSHETHADQDEHRFRPHMPSIFGHHHQNSEISGQRAFRVFTKAETNYSLTIRDGNVILARSDPSDPFQQWIKDEKYSTKVKDEQGFPCFALVNKATNQAIKHSIGATHPVRLIPYNPDYLDESILWTESKDLGDGFRTIRMVNNIRLNIDAFNGDANHGGVHDGTTIVLWEWLKGDNQRWKIVPNCKFFKSAIFLSGDRNIVFSWGYETLLASIMGF